MSSTSRKRSPLEERRSIIKPRKKRNALSLAEKLKVIEELKKGHTQREMAISLGVSKTQIQQVHSSSKQICKAIQEAAIPAKSKLKTSKARNPEIDQAVYQWFCKMRNPHNRCKPMPISSAAIQVRAKREAQLRGIAKFKASDGWLARWRWRYGVGKSVHLHGEAGDVDLEAAEKEMQALRDKLVEGGYAADHIFNMDETGLFYRAMPRRSFVLDGCDPRLAGRGTKSLKAKDRVTLVLCLNATGSCKIEPLMIGTAKLPYCFRDSPPPIHYTHQSNAWLDREKVQALVV